jgi:hypothetical protein
VNETVTVNVEPVSHHYGCYMMRFIEGEDRAQGTLLSWHLDDYVTNSNPVRVVNVLRRRKAVDGKTAKFYEKKYCEIPEKCLGTNRKLLQAIVSPYSSSAAALRGV